MKKKGINLDRGARIDVNNWEGEENNHLHKEYVEMMEILFCLKEFYLQKIGNKEDCRRVSKFFSRNIYHGVPLTLKNFEKITSEDKEKIVELFNQMTEKYGLEKHWKKDKLWELAEIKSVELFNKFLEEDYIALRSSRFDDIANKFDIFLSPLKENLPVIVIDITMKQEKNIKGKENRLFILNQEEKTPIKYGISCKSGKFIQEEIDASLWIYARVDTSLFLRSIDSQNNEVNKNNIDKEIIDMIYQSLISNFEKLKSKEKLIVEKIQEIKKIKKKSKNYLKI
ncbi:MAG: hypothetical protein HF967_00195 [Methanosarcinales archaeon]|nr:hypothetical protein [Methanosarcinales archaeon]